MPHRPPTKQETLDFFGHMTRIYRIKIIDKRSAPEMKIVAWFLDRAKIIDRRNFMKYYSVLLGNKLYLPFTPGDINDPDFPLSNQCATIIHECQHREQQFKKGVFRWVWEYATSSARRAAYEIEAYRTNMEIHFWYTGRILDPFRLGRILGNYSCTSRDIRIAQTSLARHAPYIKQGLIASAATVKALDWIRKNWGGA